MSDTNVARITRRSPAYPAFALDVALNKVQQFYAVQKHHSVPVDVAMETIGYNKGGTGLRAISAMLQYGLLEEEGSKEDRKVKITQFTYTLLKTRQDDPEYLDLLQDAATRPTIYRDLIEHYGNSLPSDTVIEKYLFKEKNFNPDILRTLIRDFKATYEFAKLDTSGIMLDTHRDTQEVSDSTRRNAERSPYERSFSHQERKLPNNSRDGVAADEPSQRNIPMNVQSHQDIPTHKFPIYGNRVISLFAPPDLSAEDIELLSEQLNIWKKSLGGKVKQFNPSDVRTGQAIWHTNDVDQTVYVTGYLGEFNGRQYVAVQDSGAGVPLDEIEYEQR